MRPDYTPKDIARLWSKIDRSAGPDACWPYLGGRSHNGYGQFTFKHIYNVRAHRVVYELANGPIPDGKFIMHTCDNPPCCNPAHLRLGTPLDNMQDMAAKGRASTGLRNGAHTHPERRPRGDTNGLHAHPEKAAKGERHGCARLTEVDVREIRALRQAGVSGAELALRFGVSRAQISHIVLRHHWKHIP